MFDVFHVDRPVRVSYTAMSKLREVVASHSYAIDDPSIVARWSSFVDALVKARDDEYKEGRYDDSLLVRVNVHARFPNQDSDEDAGGEEEQVEAGEDEGEAEVVEEDTSSKVVEGDAMEVDQDVGRRTRARPTPKKDADTVFVSASPSVDKGKKKEGTSKMQAMYLPWDKTKHFVWQQKVRRFNFIVVVGARAERFVV
jgi:hypothetical protein